MILLHNLNQFFYRPVLLAYTEEYHRDSYYQIHQHPEYHDPLGKKVPGIKYIVGGGNTVKQILNFGFFAGNHPLVFSCTEAFSLDAFPPWRFRKINMDFPPVQFIGRMCSKQPQRHFFFGLCVYQVQVAVKQIYIGNQLLRIYDCCQLHTVAGRIHIVQQQRHIIFFRIYGKQRRLLHILQAFRPLVVRDSLWAKVCIVVNFRACRRFGGHNRRCLGIKNQYFLDKRQ